MSRPDRDLVPNRYSGERLARAATFALNRHAGQVRKGTELPYAVHPERVARILAARYPGSPYLEVAGWLHDTLEDTPTTAEELEENFGPEVRRLVESVTKQDGATWHPPSDPDVMRLKAADALDNISETVDGLRRGEQVFRRFKDGPTKVVYWRAIADATDAVLQAEPIAAELDVVVTEAEEFAAAESGWIATALSMEPPEMRYARLHQPFGVYRVSSAASLDPQRWDPSRRRWVSDRSLMRFEGMGGNWYDADDVPEAEALQIVADLNARARQPSGSAIGKSKP